MTRRKAGQAQRTGWAGLVEMRQHQGMAGLFDAGEAGGTDKKVGQASWEGRTDKKVGQASWAGFVGRRNRQKGWAGFVGRLRGQASWAGGTDKKVGQASWAGGGAQAFWPCGSAKIGPLWPRRQAAAQPLPRRQSTMAGGCCKCFSLESSARAHPIARSDWPAHHAASASLWAAAPMHAQLHAVTGRPTMLQHRYLNIQTANEFDMAQVWFDFGAATRTVHAWMAAPSTIHPSIHPCKHLSIHPPIQC
eukprot:239752-Chlamydomonas_euryale.AAC.12